MKYFKKVARLCLEFLFPVFCLCCRAEGSFLCTRCFMHIPLQKKPVCPGCYADSLGGFFCEETSETCPGTEGKKRFLDGILTACSYKLSSDLQEENSSLITRLIHAFKYEFSRDLFMPLGDLLAGVWAEHGDPVMKREKNPDADSSPVVLCPVPLHRTRLKWRGYNQAELLARRVAEQTGLPVVNLLSRVRFKKAQKDLGREERLKNVEGAFGVRASVQNVMVPVRGKEVTVVLVDDVATTLATLEACAKALKQAGYQRVHGIVLARAY